MTESENLKLKSGSTPKWGDSKGEASAKHRYEAKATDERQLPIYQPHRSLREPQSC